MLTVYRIIGDVDNYQYFLPDDFDAVRTIKLKGNPIGEAWEPPPIYRANPQKKEPDFWDCTASSGGAFAIKKGNSKIPGHLMSILEGSCELLPMECDGEHFLLCNVTIVLNALNKKESRHVEGVPSFIKEYVFHPHRLDTSLFKIPETVLGEVLCLEGLAAPDDEFKGMVEELGLTGLVFQKLWSGERAKGR
ncbi:MAG: hypothetical protein WEB58_12985 [Planctomycetaceae bacterium]